MMDDIFQEYFKEIRKTYLNEEGILAIIFQNRIRSSLSLIEWISLIIVIVLSIATILLLNITLLPISLPGIIILLLFLTLILGLCKYRGKEKEDNETQKTEPEEDRKILIKALKSYSKNKLLEIADKYEINIKRSGNRTEIAAKIFEKLGPEHVKTLIKENN